MPDQRAHGASAFQMSRDFVSQLQSRGDEVFSQDTQPSDGYREWVARWKPLSQIHYLNVH